MQRRFNAEAALSAAPLGCGLLRGAEGEGTVLEMRRGAGGGDLTIAVVEVSERDGCGGGGGGGGGS